MLLDDYTFVIAIDHNIMPARGQNHFGMPELIFSLNAPLKYPVNGTNKPRKPCITKAIVSIIRIVLSNDSDI